MTTIYNEDTITVHLKDKFIQIEILIINLQLYYNNVASNVQLLLRRIRYMSYCP